MKICGFTPKWFAAIMAALTAFSVCSGIWFFANNEFDSGLLCLSLVCWKILFFAQGVNMGCSDDLIKSQKDLIDWYKKELKRSYDANDEIIAKVRECIDEYKKHQK